MKNYAVIDSMGIAHGKFWELEDEAWNEASEMAEKYKRDFFVAALLGVMRVAIKPVKELKGPLL